MSWADSEPPTWEPLKGTRLLGSVGGELCMMAYDGGGSWTEVVATPEELKRMEKWRAWFAGKGPRPW